MGLFDQMKQHYVEVIDWTEKDDGCLSYFFPMKDREIPTGAQLTVRETQLAIFLNEGKIADIFGPGRYTLNTKTLPLLRQMKQWDEHFRSPFKSDVIFFSTREQIDQRWGTATPITYRDSELGPIRVRGHGSFSYRLKNPKLFFEKLSGTADRFLSTQVEPHLVSVIVGALRGLLGSSGVNFIDLAGNHDSLVEALMLICKDKFAAYGLNLETLQVSGISLPKEMQSHFDKVASMRMVGDVKKYLIFQAAEALTQPGNEGLGMGLGLGLGLGAMKNEKEKKTSAPSEPKATNQKRLKPPAEIPDKDDDTVATLQQLREIQKKGLLTDEEVAKKVAELFKKKA